MHSNLLALCTILAVTCLLSVCRAAPDSQSPPATQPVRTFQNPILPGFHPDPSICQVGEDYYLVTSTFEYFPGIPIYHSKDLIHWELIGHVLDRPSQLRLDGIKCSEGVFAPTIRYHDGTFYVINTIVHGIGNFIVTATDPRGPWSEPHVTHTPGIDPSLFFDDDGKCWYTGNRNPPTGETYEGHRQIWLQQMDLNTFTTVGEQYMIEDGGAVKGAVHCEGPHLYKIDGWYYLLISEAGTSVEHAITVSRSKTITGPYQLDPKNPILTHRNLGTKYAIQCTGHADLIQTKSGQWWMTLLGTRPYGGGFDYTLGRETFLAPVVWEKGWPIVCPNVGKVELEQIAPDLPDYPFPPRPDRDDFDQPKLDLHWNFIRTPREEFYTLSERPGFLRLKLRPQQLTEQVNPSWAGQRQEHMSFSASTRLDFDPKAENESAGLTAVYSNNNHFRLVETLVNNQPTVQLIQRKKAQDKVLAQHAVDKGPLELRITAQGQDYSFHFRQGDGDWQLLQDKVDGRFLNTNFEWGFVGDYLGLYATSAGKPSDNHADFDWYDYQGK